MNLLNATLKKRGFSKKEDGEEKGERDLENRKYLRICKCPGTRME